MLRIPSIIDLLRDRPTTVFWAAVLPQVLLWVLVPAVLFASPPGNLPETLAIGREWQWGSWRGPPLAFWMAELAFRAAGNHVIGVYVLSQACILAALWVMFVLGRAIVGDALAAMATLLTTGVYALSVPTPEFGPQVLATPITALALLFYWRAIEEGGARHWLALAFTLGALLCASYWGLLLIALLAGLTAGTAQGRTALRSIDPWAAVAVALLVPLPHWAWLYRGGAALLPTPTSDLLLGPLLVAGVAAAHIGLVALAAFAGGVVSSSHGETPVAFERPALPAFAAPLVFFLAFALPLTGAALVSSIGVLSLTWATPLLLLSGLAVIIAAPAPLRLYGGHLIGVVWAGVLALPVLATVAVVGLMPWAGVALPGGEPSSEMGRFFSDTFARRVGKPIEIVGGDMHTASLIALASPNRPTVFDAIFPARTPWIDAAALRRNGGILVWPVTDAVTQAPAQIRARFPDMVAEVPQTFERPIPGFLPSIRIGWALIRPSMP